MFQRHQLVSPNNFLETSVNISKQQRVRVRLLKIQGEKDFKWICTGNSLKDFTFSSYQIVFCPIYGWHLFCRGHAFTVHAHCISFDSMCMCHVLMSLSRTAGLQKRWHIFGSRDVHRHFEGLLLKPEQSSGLTRFNWSHWELNLLPWFIQVFDCTHISMKEYHWVSVQ